jgi:hypothetical protein
MSITVVTPENGTVTFDNADTWSVADTAFGFFLHIEKTDPDPAKPVKRLASFNTGDWSQVKKDQNKDKALMFEEALELIGLVDNGNFGHQDSDWQERAEALLAANQPSKA